MIQDVFSFAPSTIHPHHMSPLKLCIYRSKVVLTQNHSCTQHINNRHHFIPYTH